MKKDKLKLDKGKIWKNIAFAVFSGLVVTGFLVFASSNNWASITAPVEDGLVGYWNMDSSDIYNDILYDKSGFANHAAVFGATTTIGKIKQALSFDGTNYLEIQDDNSLDLTDEITIEAWIYIPE